MEYYRKDHIVRADTQYNYSLSSKPELGSPVTDANSSSSLFVGQAYADYYRNPRWKDMIKWGQNATTHEAYYGPSPTSRNFFSAGYQMSYVNLTTGNTAYKFTEVFGSFFPIPPFNEPLVPLSSVVTSVDNRCIRKFLDRASAIQSSIEGGQDFGELKETLESILHPLNSLKKGMVSYLTTLRKRRRRGIQPKVLKKILADTYLEFRFGWQPLADDVAHLIADASRTRFDSYKIKASASDIFQADSGIAYFSPGYLPDHIGAPYLTTHKYSVHMKGAVRSLARNGVIGLDQAFQLTPKDWLPTAWDLLPYSWIADYFTNVGDQLQGLAFVDASLVWGSRSVLQESKTVIKDWLYSPPKLGISEPPYKILTDTSWIYGGNYSVRATYLERNPFTGSDLVPTFELKVPTSRYPFFNMGAILLQGSVGLRPYFK